MVAIKQLGSNGGGWYGPNSSVPLENPTPLSNLLEMIAILLIPITVIFMVGHFTRRKNLPTLCLVACFSCRLFQVQQLSGLKVCHRPHLKLQ